MQDKDFYIKDRDFGAPPNDSAFETFFTLLCAAVFVAWIAFAIWTIGQWIKTLL